MGSVTQEVNAGAYGYSPVRQAVSSLRHGNLEGFDIVYQEYSKLVRAICLRVLRNPTEAEDAAQDVFVHVLRKIHTFRGESAFSTWLYRVAMNTVLMQFRSTRHDRMASAQPIVESASRGGATGPNIALPSFSTRIDLRAALDSLPGGCKAVFILHDVQGYRHREIAQILGRSIGDSKSQLHRARQRLREFLGDTGRRTSTGDPGRRLVSRALPRQGPIWTAI